MAIVKPFRGIRPSERLVEKIVVKPFDVLNMDEAVKIGKSNPISFLHISRPEINLSKDVDWRDVLVHQRAGFEIEKFINEKARKCCISAGKLATELSEPELQDAYRLMIT